MNGKTFAEKFDAASKKLGDKAFQSEVDRVHRKVVRDTKHAFQNVEIKKPDLWKSRTHLSV